MIDVCIPTLNSSQVIKETLNKLRDSEINSGIEISCLHIIDGNSTDGTVDIIKNSVEEYPWEVEVKSVECNLPESRQIAIENVDTRWFLFLDDDVRISRDYLSTLISAVGPLIGGIQGRKATQNPTNASKWVRWRSHRSGTHATLIRTEALKDIEIPKEVVVLEDEYIRQHIEDEGWLWVYNHQAVFTHQNVGRHPISWTEGYIGGKYDLLSLPFVARRILSSILDKSIIIAFRHVIRMIGWFVGYLIKKATVQQKD